MLAGRPVKPSTHLQPELKKRTIETFVQQLNRASHWVNIEQGRTRAYVRLLEEFDRVHRRTNEHILAYYESCEIVELLDLWENRIHQFPGLKAKLQEACKKGPVVTEDEKASSSSNKPRNDLFVYLLAGKFLEAGISVGSSVDGICALPGTTASTADFSCSWNACNMNVECKRVTSRAQLPRRARDARDQIVRSGRYGIIAIDCSVLARPASNLLETDSPHRSSAEMSQWLENTILPLLLKRLSPEILGFILFARLPAMTATGILDSNEQVYRRRDCISSTLAVGNSSCSDRTILQDIAQRLREQSLAPA